MKPERLLMKKSLALTVTGLFLSLALFPQNEKEQLSLIHNTTVSGEWFLGFGYDNENNICNFRLKRGYFTIKTRLNDIFSVRYTQDITNDMEGGDSGNVEMRLKYLLLKAEIDKIGFLTNTYFEFGLVHRPWLEYELKLTGYRVQGRTFSDRYDLLSSADFGISYTGLIGGEIDREYQEKVSSYLPGRYGSFSFGVYNGGGYHAFEKNNNKIIEGRVTLRPAPEKVPGILLTYTFSLGKSNTVSNNADYRLHIFHLASMSSIHKFMAQYYTGLGGYSDDYVNDTGYSYRNRGYSLFGEFIIPKTGFALFSRYDKMISFQESKIETNTYIAGITYRFLKNKVLLNCDQSETMGVWSRLYELALEINF